MYGMFPLVRNLPVYLTDHVDRSVDKKLLRGRRGRIHSWILDDEETSAFDGGVRILRKLPKVVFVEFEGATWQLPGTAKPGLYPIKPSSPKSWFLDKGRKKPVLLVKRQQLPLAPGFATTAHSAQGATLPDAIVDLQLAAGASYLASYVALTRVEGRDGLLIFRPFQHSLFNKGPPAGPPLLLDTLRGREVDWAEVEAQFTPTKTCKACQREVFKYQFSSQQWDHRVRSHCKECVDGLGERGLTHQC